MKDLLYRVALIFWLSVCAIITTAPATAQYGTMQPQQAQQFQQAQQTQQLQPPQQAQPAQDAPAAAAPGPTLLKAGVEHSERVQPLEPALMPGQRFNANAIPMGAVVDDWICIPPWFAGTFQVDRSLVVEFVDYRTRTQLMPNRMEKIYRTFHYGHQLDSSGRVWHLNRVPYRNSIESERSVQYNLIRKSQFLHSGNDSVVETAMGPALVVKKDTGVIARSTTIETLGRFQPDANGIRKTTSIKGFNAAGMPEDLIVRVEQGTMIEPFQPDPSTAASFARFMAQRQAQREQYQQYQQYQQFQQYQEAQGMQRAPRMPHMQGIQTQGVPMQNMPLQQAPQQGAPMQVPGY